MSLINKMLSDLEQRHSYQKDHDHIVLGGLAPVVNTGFSSLKLPYHFLLVCFFIIAVIIAVYGFLTNGSEPVPAVSQADTTSVYREDTVAARIPEPVASPVTVNPALKLDISLPSTGSLQLTGGNMTAEINRVSIGHQDNLTTVHLQLDQNAQYRVYTADNPDRFILEMDNASLSGPEPVLGAHPYLAALQFSMADNHKFRMIAESQLPVRIVNSGMVAEQDGYLLTVSLESTTPAPEVFIPVLDQVLSATEAGYGQMEIRPASGSTDPLQLQMDEAVALYKLRNYDGGDAKLAALLEQEPLHRQARSLYATSLTDRGQTAKAGQVLAAGLEINPSSVDWARQYAHILVAQDKVAEAVSVLRRSLPALDNNEQYYSFYAALLQRMTRHPEAAGYYQSLLTRQPDNSLWWLGLAISQEGMQGPAQALASYKRAMQGTGLSQELKQYVSRQIGRLERK